MQGWDPTYIEDSEFEQDHIYDQKQLQDQEQGQYKRLYIKKDNQTLYYQSIPKQMKQNNIKIFNPQSWSIFDFSIGRHLGKGKFGNVYLVKQKKNQMIMALKVMKLTTIVRLDAVQCVRRELQIHSHLNHQNILKMYGFFYDQKRLYVMMEYAPKGDLYRMIKKEKKISQDLTKIYILQLVQAINYMQKLNIIHRDIKLQNILLSTDNTIKLSDFGLSIKTQSNERRTFCGTPEYFCPQIVRHKPFGKSVDNWSIGVLTYELVFGNTPFYSTNGLIMHDNIINQKVMFPPFVAVSKQFKDFVKKLIMKQPSDRMELSQALNHPWLSNKILIQSIEEIKTKDTNQTKSLLQPLSKQILKQISKVKQISQSKQISKAISKPKYRQKKPFL